MTLLHIASCESLETSPFRKKSFHHIITDSHTSACALSTNAQRFSRAFVEGSSTHKSHLIFEESLLHTRNLPKSYKMSGKLDQSLDEILNSTRRKSGRRGGLRGAKSNKATNTVAAAPVGGIKKSTKGKINAKGAPTGPSSAPRESKIMVTGLVSLRSTSSAKSAVRN